MATPPVGSAEYRAHVTGPTLVIGPAGSGKTRTLVEAVAGAAGRRPFTPALVLVPTQRHADQFRRELAARCGALFDLTVTTLPALALSLLRGAGRDVLPREVATALLDRVAAGEASTDGPAAYFRPIAGTPGLIRLLDESVAELFGASTAPAGLTRAAHDTADPRLGAIAAIYAALLKELDARGWVAPWGAATAAAQLDALPAPAVLAVDGFRTLTEGEIDFVAALAGRARTTWVSAESEDLQSRLRTRFPGATVVALSSPDREPEASVGTAHDHEAEVRAAARHIKQLLADDAALRPSAIGLAARQAGPRLRLVRQVFAEFDLPLDAAAGEPLANRPLGAWLRRLVTFSADGARLRDALPLLRSGFTRRQKWQLTHSHIALAARQARKNRLWAGPSLGTDVPAALLQASEGRPEQSRAFAAESAVAFGKAFEGLLMVSQPVSLTEGAHAARLHELLFGRDPLIPMEVAGDPAVAADCAALTTLLLAFQAVDDYLGGPPVTFQEFASRLLARTRSAPVAHREAGGVLFAPLHTLHGLRLEHLVVIGLSEGEFPAPQSRAAILDADAREKLAAAGAGLTAPGRASEDELWEVARSRAARTLSAWRTHLDDRGRPRPPSVYFTLLEGAGAAALATPQEPTAAASRREFELAAVRAWPRGAPFTRPAGGRWPLIRQAASIERLRRSFTPAGSAEGDLSTRPTDLPVLAATWSASRFESYQTCPFQFFGHYVMGLNELDEEAREADAATTGTVIHDILEAAVRPLMEARRPLSPETLPEVLALLESEGARRWDDAPKHYGFGRAGAWRLRRDRVFAELRALLEVEAQFSQEHHVERVRGIEETIDVTLDLDPPVRFSGRVDRIDEGSDVLVVTDYKSGRAIREGDVISGRRLQLQLYALAAGRDNPGRRVIARYAPVRRWGAKGWSVDSAGSGAEILATALRAAQGVLDNLKAGRFYVDPYPDECPSYCDFRRACRVNEFSRWKWPDA